MESSPIGPFLLNGNQPYLLFYAPIGDIGSSKTQGYIIGARAMDKRFQELLNLPPHAARAGESLLVSVKNKEVKYLTELADGTKPLGLSLDVDTPELASAYGVNNPSAFMKRRDYRGHLVLAAAEPIDAVKLDTYP